MVTLKDKTAIVGVGCTPYYRRGQSLPQTELELLGKAVLAATDDAGLSVDDIDGFACHSGSLDLGMVAQTLGLKQLRFGASVTGGGNGAPGSVGLAAVAVSSGQANVVVSASSVQQATGRMSSAYANHAPTALDSFLSPYGLFAPGQMAALIARRQMHRYGITREHYAEVAISQRSNAIRRPSSLLQQPLSLDDYFSARMVADPLCLFDYTLESDGAVAIVTTSSERARDLRQRPVHVSAAATGGTVGGAEVSPGWVCPMTSLPEALPCRRRGGSTPKPRSDRPMSTWPYSSTTSLLLSWLSWRCTDSVGREKAEPSSPMATSGGLPGRSRSTPTGEISPRRLSSV